ADQLNHQGDELQGRKKYRAAMDCFSRAIRLDPKHQWAYHGRAECELKLGMDEEAERDYRKAVAVNPTNKWAPWKLGTALSSQGKFAEAIPWFTRAIPMDKNPYWIYKERGEAYHALHR